MLFKTKFLVLCLTFPLAAVKGNPWKDLCLPYQGFVLLPSFQQPGDLKRGTEGDGWGGMKNTTFQEAERSRGKLPREMSVGNVNRCSSLQSLPCRGLARRPVAMQHWALPPASLQTAPGRALALLPAAGHAGSV